ncbi:NAD(P)-binding protein [Exidia glandulosa HHB12029]|uniref:NAD(P)-binding protein n=1 Tax=Exidia glandulosa HHB12029 TaxID=1314781 RepID=A0A165MSA5_EXIGL|nr:NAD(P)-binding protein [Exidia glandulosa HHB12029]
MPSFRAETTGDEVVSAFRDRVKGRIFVVTGPSPKGIGAAGLLALAKAQPKALVLAGRTPSAFASVAQQITSIDASIYVLSVTLDLSSLASVRSAAQQIVQDANIPHIDVLINNAGVMACPLERTVDGLEMQFGTNHIGHFLFTSLLMPKLLKASEPRVVNVTSSGHRFANVPVLLDDPNWEKTPYNIWVGYGQSKLANILFSKELARRFPAVKAYSAHPGSVGTDLGRHLTQEALTDVYQRMAAEPYFENAEMKTLEAGCSTTLVAALTPASEMENGAYFADCQVAVPKDTATNATATKLWELSENIIEQPFGSA